ncbi:SecY-interacting protein Syd, partial [Klebsiella pneumoniae]|uniref:SecY-interacting protein Syd n=1 Tax=Klebsiella pneumoniae TaxID=573 RepID=UPI003968DE59
MDHQTAEALRAFTQRYCAVWQQQRHSLPRSEELYGVPSPCVVDTQGEAVFWQPQPFSLAVCTAFRLSPLRRPTGSHP